jgi:rubrerythrin
MASLRDIVGVALEWEGRALDFYLRLAEETNDINVKRLFGNLAGFERKHIEVLSGIDLAGEVEVDVRRGDWVDLAAGLSLGPASDTARLKKAFALALKKEEMAYVRYWELASKLAPGGVRDILFRLASEERYHSSIIRAESMRVMGSA